MVDIVFIPDRITTVLTAGAKASSTAAQVQGAKDNGNRVPPRAAVPGLAETLAFRRELPQLSDA